MDKNTPVSKIMTRKVVVANTEKHRFSQVRQLFLKYNLHHLPVTDKDDKVLGIISSHDVLKAYEDISARLKVFDDRVLDNEIKLKDIMTKTPDTITPNATVRKAVELFAKKKYHALPVVDNGTIRGIVTSNDLIKFILS